MDAHLTSLRIVFANNASLTSWSMSYLVISRYGEELFNEFLNPDSDPDLDEDRVTPSCVIKTKSIGGILFELSARADRQIDRHNYRQQADPNGLHSHIN